MQHGDVEVLAGRVVIRVLKQWDLLSLVRLETDSKRLRELVLKHNKSLEFPLVVGNGWKIWNGILTNWNGKLLLVGCRGDIKKELDKYGDDMVEFEIESIPPQQNIKKLVKAIAVV